MWAMAVPVTSSSKHRRRSGTGSTLSMPPNPSTVPIRVSELMVGPGTPLRMRNVDCSTEGKFSGQVSSGTSRMGVENCSTRCSSQARMAGHRFRVRGDT
jgi:hypothetical protein